MVSPDASDSCNVLGKDLCKMFNADTYSLLLGAWISLQLIWIAMLIFTQLFQVSRAMTTYENMYGIQDGADTTAFTSTGTPLDPDHPTLGGGGDSGAAHNHKHKDGMLKQWSRTLGVDPFIETITGRGAATTGKGRRKKKNPYSRGCVANCKDFWCDPAPVFGQRENGTAVLGGDSIDYTTVYESPALMRLAGMRDRGGYEAVQAEDDV